MTSQKTIQTQDEKLDPLLDKAGLASRMGVSRRKLEQCVAEGEIPPGERIGSNLKWEARVADDWRRRKFEKQRAWQPRQPSQGLAASN